MTWNENKTCFLKYAKHELNCFNDNFFKIFLQLFAERSFASVLHLRTSEASVLRSNIWFCVFFHTYTSRTNQLFI